MKEGNKPKSKTGSAVEEKLWRLKMVRERINEYGQWFHPAPDEVEHLLYLMWEWAALAGIEVSENDLAEEGKNSVFPPLIRFCQDELGGIVKYCESRRAAGDGTLPEDKIKCIKELSQASDFETVNVWYPLVQQIYMANILARIMLTSYRALKEPGTLTDLSISGLRGDILEVIAYTYGDMITVMRDQAAQGIKQGIAQAENTLDAVKINRKLTDRELEEMKKRAAELKDAHSAWNVSSVARQLAEEFPKVSFHSIRKYGWLKNMVNP